MAKMREPGDPWYTVLYKEPRRFWWAQALVIFAAVLATRVLITDESLAVSLLYAAIISGVWLALTGFSRWRRKTATTHQ